MKHYENPSKDNSGGSEPDEVHTSKTIKVTLCQTLPTKGLLRIVLLLIDNLSLAWPSPLKLYTKVLLKVNILV
ncbi:hypothetical protein ACQP3J_29860, partial [Escherichia coli]